MNRLMFLKELEYLLQDIAEEDKRDAIQYYYDYFDDAGMENEGVIVKELGNPERVAAIIRADLNAELNDSGEFRETGYTDPRFEEPIKPLDKYTELANSTYYEETKKTRTYTGFYSGKRKWLKIVLTLILLSTVVPIAIDAVGGIFGGIFGFISGALGLVFLPGGLVLAGLLGGIVTIIIGIGVMFTHTLAGIIIIGTGILLVGIGFFALALSVWFYGTLMPKIFYGISTIFGTIMNRKRTGGNQE